MSMTPLRFEWRLASPLAVSNLPLHLDALVAYAITEQALQSGNVTGPIRSLGDRLPLAREQRGNDWVWQASAILPSKEPGRGVLGHETRLWTRRTDEYGYAERMINDQIKGRFNRYDNDGKRLPLQPYAGVIDTVRGLMKNHFQFIPAKKVHTVVGYAVGDADLLLELLAPGSGFITHIGARGRSGFGQILDFVMEEDPSALVKWQDRILPWPTEGAVPVQAAHRAPYWAIENRTTSYIRAELL